MMLQFNGCHEDGATAASPRRSAMKMQSSRHTPGRVAAKVMLYLGSPPRSPAQKGASRQHFEVLFNMVCDSLAEGGFLSVRSKTVCFQVSLTRNGALKRTATMRMALLRAVNTAADWILASKPDQRSVQPRLQRRCLGHGNVGTPAGGEPGKQDDGDLAQPNADTAMGSRIAETTSTAGQRH